MDKKSKDHAKIKINKGKHIWLLFDNNNEFVITWREGKDHAN